MKKVSGKIRQIILTDNDFSGELALRLKQKQQTVIAQARRNSKNLTLYEAVKFYKEKGFSENEIFENDKFIV